MKCRFCEIVKNREGEHIIYENKEMLVLLDKFRKTSAGGICLVIPKQHYNTFLEVPHPVDIQLATTVKNISSLVKKGYGAKGIRIWSAIGEAAGQSIHHCHFHIVPCNNLYDRFYAFLPGLLDKIKGLGFGKNYLSEDELSHLALPLEKEVGNNFNI